MRNTPDRDPFNKNKNKNCPELLEDNRIKPEIGYSFELEVFGMIIHKHHIDENLFKVLINKSLWANSNEYKSKLKSVINNT